MADSCAQYVNADDLKAAKESILHIEHVATSKDANGDHALSVSDPIRGQNYTNTTLDGLFADIGFKPVNGSFEDGGELKNRWNVLLYETNGSFYQWLGTLPHTVPPGSSPFDSSGQLIAGWVNQTDLTLRTQLASPSQGDLLVAAQAPGDSVPRTVHDKMLESISIADYLTGGDVAGAIIKAVAATSGTIIVPPGDYIATPTLAQVPSLTPALARLDLRGKLTIKFPAGKASLTAPLHVQCTNGENLSLVGEDFQNITITGQVSVSGSAGNYSVTLSVDNNAGVTVGDYLHTSQAVGTGARDIHRGVWPVTAVGSGTITVRNTCRLDTFPTNTITSSASRILKSVLRFVNCDGLVNPCSTLGNLSNVVLEGNSDDYWSSANVPGTEKGTHGMVIGANTIALNGKPDSVNPRGMSGADVSCGQYVGVFGFDQQGIVTELGGSLWGDFLCSCNNKRRGFYASTASGIRAKQISANGNYLDGVISDIGGAVYASSSSCSVGNGSNGISASQNGVIIFDSGKASFNKLNGWNAVAGGFVQFTGGEIVGNVASGGSALYGGVAYTDNSLIANNGSYGLYCQLASNIRMPNCTVNDNGNAGIRGSQGSVITFTGSTFSGNANGNFLFTDGSLGINGSMSYGGGLLGTDVKLVSQTTNKGVRISGTSGGDSLVISHDVNGTGTYVETYSFRSDNTGFIPTDDALKNVGRAANRFNVGFFAGGTQSTSDATLKDPIRDFNQAELNAAMRIAKMLGFWTWLDDAGKRLHAGTTVQAVLAVLEEEGLDWRNYGFIGFDEWEDEYAPVTIEVDGALVETGEMEVVREAGSVWQLRDQEFDRFVMRGLSERLSILESKLS